MAVPKSKVSKQRRDKRRANYYNFYSGKKWGVASAYDLCINTSTIGYDNAVALIVKFVEMQQNKQ